MHAAIHKARLVVVILRPAITERPKRRMRRLSPEPQL